MFRSKLNKFALALALFALIGFLSVSIGGDLLHNRIHHHNTQASHDQCAVYLLQTQVLISIIGLMVALFLKSSPRSIETCQVIFSRSCFNLPNLRAPPISR